MNGEPTEEQLNAMAYADGELDDAARREFEALLPRRPDLAREVAQLRRLQVLARHVAGPEPMDTEWARLAADPLHRGGRGLGLGLLLAGGTGGTVWAAIEILRGELPIWGKAGLGALLLGSFLLLVTTIRARARTLPFDPYTEIQR